MKTSDEYYICHNCKIRFTNGDFIEEGAPISGVYFVSPCCKKDIQFYDFIERKEENVVVKVIRKMEMEKFLKIINAEYPRLTEEYLDKMSRYTLYHVILVFIFQTGIDDYEGFLEETLFYQELSTNLKNK